MPKKLNGAGGMQEYVPAGNGDASGEYADAEGGNRHFSIFKQPDKEGRADKNATKPIIKNETEKRIDKQNNNAIISQQAKERISSIEDKNRELSYEVGTIIDVDGNVVSVYDGDHSEVYVPHELLKPNTILTHNHPKGTCFSTDDIKGLVDSEMYQLRATSPDGKTYVLTRERGFVKRSLIDDYKKVGAFRSAEENELQKIFEEYLDEGYLEYDAFLKAKSDVRINWLYKNARKYGVVFTIEWGD